MEDLVEHEQTEQPPEVDKYDQIDDLLRDEFNEIDNEKQDDSEPEADEPPVAQVEDDTEDDERPDGSGDEESTEEINYEQEVNMPDGMDAMTVGQLKDRVYEIRNIEQQLEKQTNQNMVDRDELSKFVNLIGIDNLPQEAQNQLKLRSQQQLQRENDLMLQAIPQWKDMNTFKSDRAEMLSLVSDYGMSEKAFDGITNHTHIKMILDFASLKARVHKAEQTLEVTKTKSKSKPRISPAKVKKAEFDRVSKQGSQAEKLHLIDDLLG